MYRLESLKKNTLLENRKLLIFFTFALLLLSCVLVYDVSSLASFNVYNSPFHFVISQLMWVFFAFIAFVVIQNLSIDFLKKYSYFFYIFGISLAILTVIPTPFKKEVQGASRWLILNPSEFFPKLPFIGEISIQPSEFIKLNLCFVISLVLTSKKFIQDKNKTIVILLFYIFLPCFIFLLQPSFKDVVICFIMAFFSIFFWGIPVKSLLKIFVPLFIVAIIFLFLSNYRIDRLSSFIGKGDDATTSYHQNQLKIALGSGGIFGLGFGKSIQKHEYVPEAETDSIFAIFAEEFGFIGSTVLLFIFYFYFFLLYRSVNLLSESFEKFFALNVLVWYSAQSFLNLGSITGVIPLTGVPLPLISYGGSSIIFFTIAVGVICRMLKSTNKVITKRYNL